MSEHKIALSRRNFIGASAATGIAAASIVANPLSAFATPATDKQAEAAATLDKLNAMQDQLNIAAENLNEATLAHDEAKSKMEDAQNRIDEANGKIGDLQEQLGVRARSMYRTGSSSFIDLLLGATTFQAFTTNWGILNSMNESDAEMVQETKNLRAEVTAQKEIYAQEEQIAAEKAKEAADAEAQAQAIVDEYQATYDSLSAEAAELLAQEQAAREEAERRAAQQLAQNYGNNGGGNGSGGGSGNSNKNNYDDSPQNYDGLSVVEIARMQLGKPYVYGAAGPNAFDCSGLVGFCLRGGVPGRWCTTGTISGWRSVSNPQPGDICVIHSSSKQHTGIYIGGGMMIHAANPSAGVITGPVPSYMKIVRY